MSKLHDRIIVLNFSETADELEDRQQQRLRNKELSNEIKKILKQQREMINAEITMEIASGTNSPVNIIF